jgi:Spy/CpxP family protein refolding chaperone
MAGIFTVLVPGSEPRAGGAALPQGQTTGRGSAPNPSQTPQGAVQSPRPTPGAEQFLGWDWWKDESVRKEMNLTDAQVRTIAQIFDRRVREVTPFYDEFRKQLAELDRLTQERVVDEAAYAVQVSRTEALRSKLNETRAVMLYTIYKRLDPAQYQKLRDIRDRRRGGRGNAPASRPW